MVGKITRGLVGVASTAAKLSEVQRHAFKVGTTRNMSSATISRLDKLREMATNDISISYEQELGRGAEAIVYKVNISLPKEMGQDTLIAAVRVANAAKSLGLVETIAGIFSPKFREMAEEENKKVEMGMISKLAEEVKTLQQLSHPNIPEHVGPIEMPDGKQGVLVTMCKGAVDDNLKGKMDFPSILRVLAGAASAVAHLHEKGYCHSDIKPANILLTLDGKYGLLGDFGAMTKTGEKNTLHTRAFSQDRIEPEGKERVNTEFDDNFAMGTTVGDIVECSEWVDAQDPQQRELWTKVIELSQEQKDPATQISAKEFSEKLTEYANQAEKINFSPLGDKDLHSKVTEKASKRVLVDFDID